MSRKTDGKSFAWNPKGTLTSSNNQEASKTNLFRAFGEPALKTLDAKKAELDRKWENYKLLEDESAKSRALDALPLYHQDSISTKVYFNKLNSEIVFPSLEKGPANIVIGKDRVDQKDRGYGAINPAGRSETIDLVVGRHSSSRNGDGPQDETWVNNNFFTDAARIYISQMTDIDLNFGLDVSLRRESKARSGIAIKADGVRIIGREGVRIVTGRAMVAAGKDGETNSFGGKLEPVPPIELVAGNMASNVRTVFTEPLRTPKQVKYLQPVVMGDNMVEAMEDLLDLIEEVNNSTLALGRIFSAFCSVTGIDPLRPWVPPESFIAGTLSLKDTVLNMYRNRIDMTFYRINHLSPIGYNYIPSRSVFTT